MNLESGLFLANSKDMRHISDAGSIGDAWLHISPWFFPAFYITLGKFPAFYSTLGRKTNEVYSEKIKVVPAVTWSWIHILTLRQGPCQKRTSDTTVACPAHWGAATSETVRGWNERCRKVVGYICDTTEKTEHAYLHLEFQMSQNERDNI